MPGCVLRVEIKTSNVEHAIEASGLRPITVLQKGTPRVSPARIARRSIGSTTRYRTHPQLRRNRTPWRAWPARWMAEICSRKVVSRIFASWNQLDRWLRQVERLRHAA